MRPAELADLKEAADRLAFARRNVDEEDFVAEFKQLRQPGKANAR